MEGGTGWTNTRKEKDDDETRRKDGERDRIRPDWIVLADMLGGTERREVNRNDWKDSWLMIGSRCNCLPASSFLFRKIISQKNKFWSNFK
jgi:hypothetical protein